MMYKIMYLKTGNVFILPENEANHLKTMFPEDYKILEKNGKKFKDVIKKTKKDEKGSIYSQVVEQEQT